ncbi:MAG: hypothetical protein Q7S26_02430 [bacterium]|nr:hypothetical protein [bacterium]
MKVIHKTFSIYALAFALVVTAFGASFDAWWHVSQGRASFFVLPHLFIYGGVIASLLFSFVLAKITHQKIWKWFFLSLLVIPATAPFDELWHRVIGVERVESVLMVWSPPHLVLFVAAIVAIILFMTVLKKERDIVSERITGSLMLASLFNLLFIVLVPLFPLGPYHLLGFWGAGVTTFVFVVVALTASYLFPGVAAATTTALFFILFHTIVADANIYGNAESKIYGHLPNWVLILSYAIPAAWIDISKKLPIFLRTTVAAVLWSTLFFGFANEYLGLDFQFSSLNFYQALLSSIVGGVLAGIFFRTIEGNLKKLRLSGV